MSNRPYKFEIFEDRAGEWRWRLVATANGKIVADSGEGYASRWNVKRAVKQLVRKMSEVES